MRFEMVKLVPDEDGVNEKLICDSKEDFLETFGEYYEMCIKSEESDAVVLSYPEEMQPIMTEVFDNTLVASFWTNPMLMFNQGVLDYCMKTYGGEEGAKRVWLMVDYQK
jgi:hypothetical protein